MLVLLGVVAVGDAADDLGAAPLLEVALHALPSDAEAGGEGDAGGGVELGGGEFAEDAGGVLDEHPGDGHRGAEVLIEADEAGGRQLAGVE